MKSLKQIRDYCYAFQQGSEGVGPWSVAQMNAYIEEARDELFHFILGQHKRFFESYVDVSEVAGTWSYELPTDVSRVLRIMRMNNGTPCELEQIAARADDIERMESGLGAAYMEDRNEGYYLNGVRTMVLLPCPTSSATDSLRVHFVWRPKRLGDNADLMFQRADPDTEREDLTDWEHIIQNHTLYRCAMQEEDYQKAQMLQGDMQRGYASIAKWLAMVNTQSPRQIMVDELEDDEF